MAANAGERLWSSRLGFLMAVIGSAVGLGALWRFPYMAGEHGGAAFVILYLGLALFVGVPLVMAELAIGRRGRKSPFNTMRALCESEHLGRIWLGIGLFSLLAPAVALSFYSVIAAWSLDYIFKALRGAFAGLDGAGAAATFDGLLASPGRMAFWHGIYIIANVAVVGRGIRRGIESTTKIMMPALFVMLLGLVVYANIYGDAAAGARFLFEPDFSKITGETVLMALGQMLFSVSVGTGALMCYGAYLQSDIDIPAAGWIIALTVVGTCLLAALAIFPIVFAAGLEPAGGPGLSFIILPVAFGQMPGGTIIGAVFFVLVFFAAVTSSFAMLEPVVAYFEERHAWPRFTVTAIFGAITWVLGLASVFSFNLWEDFTPIDFIPLLADKTIFDLLDFSVSNVLLPANAFLLALCVGWAIPRKLFREQFPSLSARGFALWGVLVRYVAPIAVGLVMYSSLRG